MSADVEPASAAAPAGEMRIPEAKSWAVAWTKARCEKALVEFFGGQAVPCFLPLVRNRRVYGGRVRFSELPLFPGYVFFDLEVIPRPRVFESRKVAQILVPRDQDELVGDLTNLALALSHDTSLRETRFGMVGRKVQVARGPMKGLMGSLVRLENRCRLIVRVSFIGKAAELEIDEAFVDPVF